MTVGNFVTAVLVAGLLGILAGCGGGSGGSTTKVTGAASKGIIFPGSVSIYAVDTNGVKGTTPLATVPLNSSGQFSADIGAYRGSVVAEVTGVYTDEATGSVVTINAGRPMRAVASGIGNNSINRLAITPLTDLAYSITGPALTPTAIAAATARISDIFKVSDISSVMPVQPDATILGNASLDQQAYTVALTTLSQMAKSGNPGGAGFNQITALLDSFKTDLSASATAGLGPANTAAFAAALSTAITTQLPGVSGSLAGLSTASATLSGVGSRSMQLTFATAGLPAGALIGGIQGSIALPAGTAVRVKQGAAGEVLSTVYAASGKAAGALTTASFASQTFSFALISSSGFGEGEFATLTIDVTSGAPTAESFTVSNLKLIDLTGAPMNAAVSIR